jgi:hypothetical protein
LSDPARYPGASGQRLTAGALVVTFLALSRRNLTRKRECVPGPDAA